MIVCYSVFSGDQHIGYEFIGKEKSYFNMIGEEGLKIGTIAPDIDEVLFRKEVLVLL